MACKLQFSGKINNKRRGWQIKMRIHLYLANFKVRLRTKDMTIGLHIEDNLNRLG